MTIDDSLQARFVEAKRLHDRQRRDDTSGGAGGDEPPTGSLGPRVSALEGRADKIESKLDAIEERLRSVEIQGARIEATLDLVAKQIVGKLPSWWQVPTVIGATVGLLAVLLAATRHFHLLN